MKELKDTLEMMTSPDYNDHFLAEYYQLDTRIQKLECILRNWDAGTLKFDPTCPRATYDLQLEYMKKYRAVLEMRAKMEDIDITEV